MQEITEQLQQLQVEKEKMIILETMSKVYVPIEDNEKLKIETEKLLLEITKEKRACLRRIKKI